MMEWVSHHVTTVVVGRGDGGGLVPLLPDGGLADNAHRVLLVGRNARVHFGEKVLQVLH